MFSASSTKASILPIVWLRVSGAAAFASAPAVLGDDDRAPDRALVTYVSAPTFQLLGERPLLGRDFEPRDDHGGLFLKPGAMQRYFESYEKWMLTPAAGRGEGRETFRGALREEVQAFAKFLKSGSTWSPFVFTSPEADAAGAS